MSDARTRLRNGFRAPLTRDEAKSRILSNPQRFAVLPAPLRDDAELAWTACHLDGMQLRNASPRLQNDVRIREAAFEECPEARGLTLKSPEASESRFSWVPRLLRFAKSRIEGFRSHVNEHRADHGPLFPVSKLKAPLLNHLRANPSHFHALSERAQAHLDVLEAALQGNPALFENAPIPPRVAAKLAVLNGKGETDWRAYFRRPALLPLLCQLHPEAAPMLEMRELLESLDIEHVSRLPADPGLASEILENRLTSPADDSRPLMVAIFPKRDPNGGFDDPGLAAFCKSYRVVYYEAKSSDDMLSQLMEATAEKRASRAWIAGHGKRTEIRFGHDDVENPALQLEDEERMRAMGIERCFEPAANIVLQACSTGSGRTLRDNMVNLWHRVVPGAHVIGPRIPSWGKVQEVREDGTVIRWDYGLNRRSLTHSHAPESEPKTES